MPSPFPGMNPYIEKAALWRDFHPTFLVFFRTALTGQLAPRYFVELEVLLYPETATVLGVTQEKTRRLLVRDTDNQHIVTVVELLSPSNKEAGADRTRYIDKRTDILTSRVNLVELDFLRGGPRLPVRTLPPCAYYALVSRHWLRPKMGLWPIGLRDPLPQIPIPLRENEAEPSVELQAVLNQTYDSAAYAGHIYRRPPEPQLPPDDATWARGILTDAGLESS